MRLAAGPPAAWAIGRLDPLPPSRRGVMPARKSLDEHLRRELDGDAVVVAGDGVAARMRPTPQREAELLATTTGAALLRELCRREERIRASAGSDRPIVEALEEQSKSGVSGDVGVAERAQVIHKGAGPARG